MMEIQVEVGDGVFTAPDPSPGGETARTSAGEAAQAEYAKVLSDPAHPMHAPFKRGDPNAHAYIDRIYKNAYPGTAPHNTESVSIGGTVPAQPGETLDQAADRERNEVILSPLKTDWGVEYEARMSGVRAVARDLFGGEGWGEVFEDLGASIRQHYGPAGETAALRFLHELAKQKI